MRLINIVDSSAVFVFADVENVKTFTPDIVAVMREKYRFVEYPKTADEYAKEVSLSYGYFENSVIDKVTIFNDGILISCSENTVKIDIMLNDIIHWMSDLFNIRLDQLKKRSFYNSKIEIGLDDRASDFVDRFCAVSKMLDRFVAAHGMLASPYAASSLGFYASEAGGPTPGRFLIEPRAGAPLIENRFFSEAPVTTDEHITLIEALENLF